MQVKKNPKKDMRRWSLVFFEVGLIVVLFITWRAIENKTYEKKEHKQQIVNLSHMVEEDVPVTQVPKNTPPPPPPPPAPQKIKVVENDVEVEETEIAPTEDIPDVQPVQVADVQEAPAKEEPVAEVAFQAIQDVPIFPGCGKFKSNKKRRECMSQKVNQFVHKRFNSEIGSELGLSGINKIYVQFIVDSKGNITNVKARNIHPELRAEAKRVVKLLPHMTPGKQRGKPVKVRYTLPLVFQVN